MPEIMRRQFLREREGVQLLDEFSEKLGIDVRSLLDAKKPSIEVAEALAARIYYANDRPIMARVKETLIPTLLFEKSLQSLPKIVVNMGAVPYICNGADVLAPGIVEISGTFAESDYVVVVDERHQKPLAIAMALSDSQAARELSRGKVAKNLHYVGDALWNLLKKG
jgi:PUA-domain protein